MNNIIDPTNGNHVSLFSSQGKSLLKQYVKLYQRGGFHPQDYQIPLGKEVRYFQIQIPLGQPRDYQSHPKIIQTQLLQSPGMSMKEKKKKK